MPSARMAREDGRLAGEIAVPPRHVGRTQRLEEIVQAVGVIAHAVEPEEDAAEEHLPQSPVDRIRPRASSRSRPSSRSTTRSMEARASSSLLGEMEVDGPLADPGFAGHVVHRHLPVPEPRQQPLGRVQDPIGHRRFLSHAQAPSNDAARMHETGISVSIRGSAFRLLNVRKEMPPNSPEAPHGGGPCRSTGPVIRSVHALFEGRRGSG